MISSIRSWGGLPSTVQPTDWHVPRISFTVPLSFLDIDLCLMARAIETISSNDKFPLCLIFFCLFLSLGGSLSALITKEAADGTTEMVACLFWIVSCTVIFKPFQSLVALAISSPTFLGDCEIIFDYENKTSNIFLFFFFIYSIEIDIYIFMAYQTKWTNFWGKRRSCSNFTTNASQIHYKRLYTINITFFFIGLINNFYIIMFSKYLS